MMVRLDGQGSDLISIPRIKSNEMENGKIISPSLEDYLKAIYLLNARDNSVRLVDIAERLSVSKPSANWAVTVLTEKELVTHTPYGPILLTAKGIEAAEKLIAKCKTIKQFLMQILNIDESLADSEACIMEHVIDNIILDKMLLMI